MVVQLTLNNDRDSIEKGDPSNDEGDLNSIIFEIKVTIV